MALDKYTAVRIGGKVHAARFGDKVRKELEEQAGREGRTISRIIRQAVVEYLDRQARTDDDVTVERPFELFTKSFGTFGQNQPGSAAT
ncbi:CopG family transcriptional regulator [Oceanidesulfovibrio marinus]|uniref:Ribbon-helix-helix protein CopG domain-containing protein n=1 Tax=Oceanidesulfovibrio marinus TaxID=370038 RepID=A0A6P1ZLV7_9BACT|nr:CopG family transcriptional regulator [Oceanidesulfovibrio marinus]TVM34899.1 hypothetical protein DQK91_05675 [Oceanidesulfovibrio marinus]